MEQELAIKDAEIKELKALLLEVADGVEKMRRELRDKDAEFEKKCKECEYDPQAAQFGWFLEHGWLPPGEIEKLRRQG